MSTNVTVIPSASTTTQITVVTGEGSTSYRLDVGRRGPQGPQGIQGIQGETGPEGPPGSSAWNDLTSTVDIVPFTTTNGGPEETGDLAWDVAEETLSIAVAHGAILRIGEDVLYHVENVSGTNITKGSPVSYAGTVGLSGKLRVKPWNGSVDDPKSFMGLATTAIDNGSEGYITHFGKIKGINTNAFAAGSILYANQTGTGLTTTEPSGGEVVTAAVCISSGNNGTVFVRSTVAGGANWDAIDGVPSTFTPSAHTHPIADILLSAGTDIGADLADADLILVDDGATGTNRKSAISRVWDYIKGKLDGVLTIAGAKTLSGQLELTGQSATNATSAMTLGLSDARYASIATLIVPSQNTTFTSDDTLRDVGLRVTLPVGRHEIFAAIGSSSGGSSTGGLKTQLVVTSGTITGGVGTVSEPRGFSTINRPAAATTYAQVRNGILGQLSGAGGAGGQTWSSVLHGIVNVTAEATISFHAAQNASDATTTTVRADSSYMLVRSLPTATEVAPI